MGDSVPEEWRTLLDQFEQRVEFGRGMGGPMKLAARAEAGLLTARQLIELLVDRDSFRELGTLVGGATYQGTDPVPADALVGGAANIEGRPVVVACEDFTTKGGSIGHGTNAKRVRLARLAAQEKVPYILLLDGAGARMTNSLERHPYAPSDLVAMAELSGRVPTVAVVIGSSAGHGALSGVMADWLVMTETASLFSAGPPLVAAALGEKVSKEQLGGAAMHATTSGVCHNLVRDGVEACAMVRRYLGYLPSRAGSAAPRAENESAAGAPRRLDDILEIIPRDAQRPYDIRKVIERVADAGSFLEIQPAFGRSMVVGLARLGCHSVAVVANQPTVLAGAITREAADKATHFIDLANSYHLPVVFLADNPGIMSGTQAEQAGTLRAAARMYVAQARLASPKLHVTLRKAFGFGSSIMAMNPFDRQTLTLALPGIALGGIPVKGGDSAAKLDAATADALAAAEASGAWTAGDTMAYDEIIDPRELRNRLLSGLALAERRLAGPQAQVLVPPLRP